MCEYHSLQYTTAGIAENLSITTTTQLRLLNANKNNKKNKAKFIPWRYGSSIWEMSKGLERGGKKSPVSKIECCPLTGLQF
jgi:hypothetical protein